MRLVGVQVCGELRRERGEERLRVRLRQESAQRAAGIFAAKEAALKALGCGLSGAALCEAEVKWNGAGRPELSFHGRAYEKFKALGGVRSHLSITHIDSAATAFAGLEGD